MWLPTQTPHSFFFFDSLLSKGEEAVTAGQRDFSHIVLHLAATKQILSATFTQIIYTTLVPLACPPNCLLPHQPQHLTNTESLNTVAQPTKPEDTNKGPFHSCPPTAYKHLSMNQPDFSMQHMELKGICLIKTSCDPKPCALGEKKDTALPVEVINY